MRKPKIKNRTTSFLKNSLALQPAQTTARWYKDTKAELNRRRLTNKAA